MANQRGSRITGLRLRTKLQLSLLLISALLTCGTLLIVHQIVMAQVRRQIFDDLQNSVATFRNLLRQREVMRARSAALISNLPNLKALMTSHDAATIQDASQGTWDLAGSDLFILGDRDGKVLALHTSAPGFTRGMAEAQIRGHASEDQMGSWWFGGGRLYQVFLQPIYFGSERENHVLGVLAMGYEVDERLAHEVSRIAGSEVNITYGDSVIATTLRPSQESDLSRVWRTTAAGMAPLEITLDGERFLTTRLSLESSNLPEAALTILKSYDQAASFLNRLNRMVLGIGITAVVLGSLLIYLISLNFTRPLENLAAGVKALGASGPHSFPNSFFPRQRRISAGRELVVSVGGPLVPLSAHLCRRCGRTVFVGGIHHLAEAPWTGRNRLIGSPFGSDREWLDHRAGSGGRAQHASPHARSRLRVLQA